MARAGHRGWEGGTEGRRETGRVGGWHLALFPSSSLSSHPPFLIFTSYCVPQVQDDFWKKDCGPFSERLQSEGSIKIASYRRALLQDWWASPLYNQSSWLQVHFCSNKIQHHFSSVPPRTEDHIPERLKQKFCKVYKKKTKKNPTHLKGFVFSVNVSPGSSQTVKQLAHFWFNQVRLPVLVNFPD